VGQAAVVRGRRWPRILCAMATPWYVEAFRGDYRDVYAHRNLAAARQEVRWLAEEVLAGIEGPILDDCCGFGRHSLALAEAGFDIFGIDLSFDLLASSGDMEGARQRLSGRLGQADMRALPFASRSFAAVVNLFTSFGYLGEAGDGAALDEMARVLRPGGTLVMDLMNPAAIRRGLRPSSREERDGIVLEARRFLEDGGRRVVKEVELTLAGGEVRRWREEVRMYEPRELDALLAARGLRVVGRAGSFDGEPFDPDQADRQVVLARS